MSSIFFNASLEPKKKKNAKNPFGFFTLSNSLKASNCQSDKKNANYILSVDFALCASASPLIKLICLIHQAWTFQSRVSGVLGSLRSAQEKKGSRSRHWKCHCFMRDSARTRRDALIIWVASLLPVDQTEVDKKQKQQQQNNAAWGSRSLYYCTWPGPAVSHRNVSYSMAKTGALSLTSITVIRVIPFPTCDGSTETYRRGLEPEMLWKLSSF